MGIHGISNQHANYMNYYNLKFHKAVFVDNKTTLVSFALEYLLVYAPVSVTLLWNRKECVLINGQQEYAVKQTDENILRGLVSMVKYNSCFVCCVLEYVLVYAPVTFILLWNVTTCVPSGQQAYMASWKGDSPLAFINVIVKAMKDLKPDLKSMPILHLISTLSSSLVMISMKNYVLIKDNCKRLGGNLVELETSEENEFLKDKWRTLNTTVDAYWIGGYNFNNDGDMEWISKPNQVMPFNDMQPGQMDGPMTELCLMFCGCFDFRWADHYCDTLLPYICEF
ncbi:CLEC3A [Mytilus edulis]|uniref:CLEC3A n=1 Tax=Mytilus edulis TaxID=6550 RepID=A0A8S3QM70_MYTED|nr:CLEC3A [Mytilus edulis]